MTKSWKTILLTKKVPSKSTLSRLCSLAFGGFSSFPLVGRGVQTYGKNHPNILGDKTRVIQLPTWGNPNNAKCMTILRDLPSTVHCLGWTSRSLSSATMTGLTLIWWSLLTHHAAFFEVSQRGGRNAWKSLSTFAPAKIMTSCQEMTKKHTTVCEFHILIKSSGGLIGSNYLKMISNHKT